jgi:hypothetical protein
MRLGAVVLLVVSTACAPRTSTLDGEASCDQLCLADPTPHCVSADPFCTTSAECASGLTCTPVDGANRCSTRGDRVARCRPAPINRLALQTQFGVGGMTIHIEPTPGVTWTAPRKAEIVACALFSCNPSFKTIGSSPARKGMLKMIDNFDQCVLLFGTSPASQSQFPLINENAYVGSARCTDPFAGPRVITELAAACWAYDSTSIIAASELVRVPGAIVSEVASIPHDEACRGDGDACYDAAADRFGICLAGTCEKPCVTAADCPSPGDSQSPGTACGWTCQPLPDGEHGACVTAQ